MGGAASASEEIVVSNIWSKMTNFLTGFGSAKTESIPVRSSNISVLSDETPMFEADAGQWGPEWSANDPATTVVPAPLESNGSWRRLSSQTSSRKLVFSPREDDAADIGD